LTCCVALTTVRTAVLHCDVRKKRTMVIMIMIIIITRIRNGIIIVIN